jgi:hypothetical protein
MDEVDDVLDRLAYEIDVRERRIAELEGHAPAEVAAETVEEEPSQAPAPAPALAPAQQEADTAAGAPAEGAEPEEPGASEGA